MKLAEIGCSPVRSDNSLIETNEPSRIQLVEWLRYDVEGSDFPSSGRVNFVRPGNRISGQTRGDLA